MSELRESHIDNDARIGNSGLDLVYMHTKGQLEVPTLLYGKFDGQEFSVSDLQTLMEQEIVQGRLQASQEPEREAQDIAAQIHKTTNKYPWLGYMAAGGAGLLDEPRAFELATANHMFDDNPLPFGISLAEGGKLRGFMETETYRFRAIASQVFAPEG